MSNLVELNVDLRAGTISIKAGAEGVSAILDRVETMLEKFWINTPIHETDQANAALGVDESTGSENSGIAPSLKNLKNEEKNRRPNGKSASKRTNWNISDLGFDAEKRKLIKDEFEKMIPKTQNDQVAAIAILLAAQLKTKEFDGHQIASGLRMAGAKIPGNLIAVFGNMRTEHVIDVKDGKLIVTGYLEDYAREMPAKNVKKTTK